MSYKANISMNGILYAWLSAVGRRMGVRSVPGTARAILQAVMMAAQSEDAVSGMMWMITGSAAFAIYDLLYGDANAEAYVGANSHDQAKKCFDVIRG